MQHRLVFSSVIITVLLFCSSLHAQEALTQCLTADGEVCSIATTGIDWTASGSADTSAEGSELLLTQDLYNQYGQIDSNFSICATEYRVSFEIFLGEISGELGGAGISFIETNSKGDTVSQVEYDTYFNSCGDAVCPWFPYEINDNHVSIDTDLAPENGSPSTYGLYTYDLAEPAFSLTGSGWLQGSYYYQDGLIESSLSDGAETIFLAAETASSAFRTVSLSFLAYTNSVGKNEQSVRNIQVEIIKPCESQVKTDLEEACPAYAEEEICPLECVKATLHSLWEQDAILYDEYDNILEDCLKSNLYPPQESYDAGYQSGYDEGYAAGFAAGETAGFDSGVASIDVEAIYQGGFDAGKASVDTDQYYNDGFVAGAASIDTSTYYNTGFSAGVASVDTSVFYQSGFADGAASVNTESYFNDGYTLGVASVDTEAFYQEGYNAGVASVDTNAFFESGYDEGFVAGAASIDIQSISEVSYQEGFSAGEASVDITGLESAAFDSGYELGFDEGVLSVPACDKPLKKLKLTALECEEHDRRLWQVENPNNRTVVAKWEVLGSNQAGEVMVEANGSVVLDTKALFGFNLLRVHLGDKLQSTKASGVCLKKKNREWRWNKKK